MMSKKIIFMVVLLILLAFREKGRRKLSSLQQMSMDLWEIRQGGNHEDQGRGYGFGFKSMKKESVL